MCMGGQGRAERPHPVAPNEFIWAFEPSPCAPDLLRGEEETLQHMFKQLRNFVQAPAEK